MDELPLCLCGCGGKVSKPTNKFINRHHVNINNPMKRKEVSEKVRLANIGREKSKEEIEKIKESCKGINKGSNNGMYGKIGILNPLYGIPKPKYQIDKIKETIKNNGGRKGKNNSRYGVRLSQDIKDKIGKGNTGKIRSDEFKLMMSKRMSGSNHPNWIGGCTNDGYCEEWRTIELKQYIIERDDCICQNPVCNKISLNICVHHIDYNKKNCDPNNLITVCVSCNSIANFNRGWHESFYKEIVRRKYL